ncbi:hypothetical protein TNCV_4200141 [Trichonephila clavipes]|uniref:Uncharacterized protein n=1 Tax=Trichonephila clavipes TaxID=2585209 RepID=A0A8X6WB13_TRICX|nr:hypothetical protein TNCV_4200141 [Trichonephila clavipes]
MTWAEMGRPPLSAKNAKTQTPHNTSKSNFNRNKEREKKLQQIKRIYEVQCPNMLYMSTKTPYNQYPLPKHNIAPTIKLSSQPEQQIKKKKLTNPNIPEKKRKLNFKRKHNEHVITISVKT